ncbi:MAG: methyltransferase [Paenibacillus sp.]|nr:methyltransferase [Paenibacillus sp.]
METTSRLKLIRKEERKYHEKCFENYKLYQKGSWLHKPVPVIMEYASRFNLTHPVHILDLGCGVGRNSIPMARLVKDGGGKVHCVDLLDKALEKLKEYRSQYGVESVIETEQADIGEYRIREAFYDYIVAASSLEHVKSETVLREVLGKLAAGTKFRGINCIIMNTNIEEYDKISGQKRKPLIEIVMTKERVLETLRTCYDGWEQLHVSVSPMELEIERAGEPVILKADTLCFVVRKR